MTGTAPPRSGARPEITAPAARRREDNAAGPLAALMGQSFIVGTLLFSFGVLFERLPPAFSMLLLVPALACAVLTPRRRFRHLRFSAPFVLLVLWMLLSWTWSVNPDETLFRLWTQVPLLLAMMLVTSLLTQSQRVTALRWSIRLTLLIVLQALLTDSAARISGSEEFVVPGWRGTFPDKNSLGLYLVFALTVTMMLDRGRSRFWTTVVIAVLLVGSQSATSMSAAALVFLLWRWVGLWRRQEGRASALFLLASIGLLLCLLAAILLNVTAILEVYGKDADLTGRTDIWAAVVQAVRQEPLTGYGLGALLNTQSPSSATLELWHAIGFGAAHAHNGALDVLGQLGVVGLLLYAATVATTYLSAVRRLRIDPAPATAVIVMLTGLMLMSFSENVYLGPWLLVLALLQAPLHDDAVVGGRRWDDAVRHRSRRLLDSSRVDRSSGH